VSEKDSASIRALLLQLTERLEKYIVAKQNEPDLCGRDATEPVHRSVAELPRSRRVQIEKPGRVILNGWPLEMVCLITDLWVVGARLKLPCIFTLPDTFDVTIIDSQKTFLSAKIWQRGVDVGVGFVDVRPHALRAEEQKTSTNAIC
jgi:hypothetical protein